MTADRRPGSHRRSGAAAPTGAAGRARTRVRRFVLVALALPAAVVLGGLAVLLLAAPALPDPVAVHWGADGRPDGFGPLWLTMLLVGVTGLGLPLLLTITSLPSLRAGDHGRVYPFLGAFSLGLGVFVTVLVTTATMQQIGLASADDAPAIWIALIAALVLAAGAGAAGWFLQPRDPFAPVRAEPTEPTVLAPAETAVWVRRVTISPAGAVVLGSAVLLLVVITVITAIAVDDVLALWITAAATVFVSLAVLTNCAFHVRIDDSGLSVTSAAGWPRVHLPLTEVRDAAHVQVEPMGEFGGWGMRWAPGGKFGVVSRRGPGIEVRRTNGKTLTVTVDDAQTGAALLNGLVARRAQDTAPGAPTVDG